MCLVYIQDTCSVNISLCDDLSSMHLVWLPQKSAEIFDKCHAGQRALLIAHAHKMSSVRVASFPGRFFAGEEKTAWVPLFVHAWDIP